MPTKHFELLPPSFTVFTLTLLMALILGKATGFSNSGASPKRAYVTYLINDDRNYAMGVVGLAKGLRKVGSAYPLVVAVLPEVSEAVRQLLLSQGCIVREIELVYPPKEYGTDNHNRQLYSIKYSKLRIWEFVEYNTMVYLQADAQVFNNIDELFDLPYLGFSTDIGSCGEKTWSKINARDQDKMLFEISCNPISVVEIRVPAALYFNAGMFMFEPDVVTAKRLEFDLNIRQFMDMFFLDMCLPTPQLHNFLIAIVWPNQEKGKVDRFKVVQYCHEEMKPWNYPGKLENRDHEMKRLVDRWWDIYNDNSLDYKPAAVEVEMEPEAAVEIESAAMEMEPEGAGLRAALSKDGVVHSPRSAAC